MLRTTIRFLFSESAANVRELLRRCQALEQQIGLANEKLTSRRQEYAAEEKKLATRNKQIHELRSQLTSDVLKGQEYWKSAKNKSELHRKQSIQNFAKTLTGLTPLIKQIKTLQKESHDADLREGFELTTRLFFNTLEKYKILEFEPQLKTKFNKQEMVAEGEVKAENEKDRGTVAKVIQPGHTAEGKVIHKAKVLVYN